MFEYEDEFGILTQFTQQDVDNRAKEKGLSTEEYLSSNPEVKPVKVEKTNDVAETGAPVTSKTPAPESGDSPLDDTSSESVGSEQVVPKTFPIEEVTIKPRIMSFEDFRKVPLPTFPTRLEKQQGDKLSNYYESFGDEDLSFDYQLLDMRRSVTIKSGYLLKGEQAIKLPKANASDEKWQRAYDSYTKLINLHFEGVDTAPKTEEERAKVREDNKQISKNIIVQNLNFDLKEMIEASDDEDEKERLQEQINYNNENVEEVADAVEPNTALTIANDYFNDIEAERRAAIDQATKDFWKQRQQDLPGEERTGEMLTGDQYLAQDAFIQNKLDQFEKEKSKDKRYNLYKETVDNYNKAAEELQKHGDKTGKKFGGLVQLEKEEGEFINTDWAGEDKTELLKGMSYKEVQALALGDYSLQQKEAQLNKAKGIIMPEKLSVLQDRNDELTEFNAEIKSREAALTSQVKELNQKAEDLKQRYSEISPEYEKLVEKLQADSDALESLRSKDVFTNLDKLEEESLLKNYRNTYKLYEPLRKIVEGLQSEGDELNNTGVDLENKQEILQSNIDDVNAQGKELDAQRDAIYTEFAFDVANKVFANNFKLTDEYHEWKNKNVNETSGVFGSIRDLGNRVGQGVGKEIIDLYVGTGIWATNKLGSFAKGALGLGSYSSSEYVYDRYDRLNHLYKTKVQDFEFVPVADELEGSAFSSYKHSMQTLGNMLPFTLTLIGSARKGDFIKTQRAYRQLSKLGTSKKMLQAFKTGETAFRLTLMDNYADGKNFGLSDDAALEYSQTMSLVTSIASTIMPDYRLLGGTNTMKGFVSAFQGSLKKAATKQAGWAASKQFTIDYVKELGEEEVELVLGDMAKHTFNLSHATEFQKFETHQQILEGTLLLSGSLKASGSAMGTGDFKTFKNQIYDGFRERGNEVIEDMTNQMAEVQAKIDEATKVGDQVKVDLYKELMSEYTQGRDYAMLMNNAINISPESVTNEQLDLITQKQELLNLKKETDPAFHVLYDNQIEEINKKIATSDVVSLTRQNFDRTVTNATTIGSKMGVVVKAFDGDNSTQDMYSWLAENTNISEGQLEESIGTHGGAFTDADGNNVMVINKPVALSSTGANVAAHELLHKTMAMTIAERDADGNIMRDEDGELIVNKEAAIALQEGLGTEIMKMDPTKISNSIFRARIEAYQSAPSSIQAQELLTLFSDALATGDIKFEENVFTKVGDYVRRSLQKMGMNITFRNGRDVFNFLRDYNDSIKKGDFNIAQEAMFKKGAKFKGEISKLQTSESVVEAARKERLFEQTEGLPSEYLMSKDADEVNRLYTEKGVDGAFEIAGPDGPYRGMAENIFSRYLANAQTEDIRQDLLREKEDIIADILYDPGTETAKGRTILGLVRDYPAYVEKQTKAGEKVAPLSGFVNNMIGERVKETFAKRGAEDVATKSMTEEGIAKEAEGIAEEKTTEQKERKTKLKVLADQLKVEEEVTTTVEAAGIDPTLLFNFKSVPNAVADVVGKLMGISPKKIKSNANITKGELASAQMFIKKNVGLLIDMLPEGFDSDGKATGVPKTILEAFYNKRSARAKTKAGLNTQVKKANIKDAEFLEVFGIVDGVPDRTDRNTSARVISLSNVIGKVMTNQSLRKQNPDIIRIADGMSTIMFSKEDGKSKESGDINLNKIEGKEKQKDWLIKKGFSILPKSFWLKEGQLVGSGAVYENVIVDGKKVKKYETKEGERIAARKMLFANVDQLKDFIKEYEKNGGTFAPESDNVKAAIKRTTAYGKKTDKQVKDQIKKNKDSFDKSDKGFVDLWMAIQKDIKDNPGNKKHWAALLEVTSTTQANWMRVASRLIGGNTLGLTNVEEHMSPATDFAQYLWEMAKINKLTPSVLKKAMKSYTQISLPEIYDNLLKGEDFNYKDNLPLEFKFEILAGIMPSWIRYINPQVNAMPYTLNGKQYYGVNPNVIVLANGNTLAEEFGLGVAENLKMNQDVISVQQELLFKVFTNNMVKADAVSSLNTYVAGISIQKALKPSTVVETKTKAGKILASKDLDPKFNKMLERTKGIGAEKTFSRIGAQKRGKNVGRFTFFVPPSADDFSGLLRYFVGKGEQGNADLSFFNEALIKPFARADEAMKQQRQTITNDYKALRKKFPQVKKKLGKMIGESGFTNDNAIRVYLWNKAGFDIPGLSKRDIKLLVSTVSADVDMRAFADTIGLISKQKEGYTEPGEHWNVESIASDLQNVVNKVGRKKYLAEWIENKNEIFSKDNLNKIEATYGSNFREALENILWRMENGTNRAKGMGRIEGAWNNWVNNSVGAIMFFNARSAVLQTLSTVNFINFEDNNMFAAAKAFANQKQYWKDFSFLFNSDFLKQRRAGLQINVNEAELASAVAGATNKAKAALQYLLKIGFLPTQIADSFAIASGGSTYYRNRVKKYVKEGMDQKAAEEQSMLDFMEIAEETQQSSRPDRISQQQASSLGRIILAFANTPMQYARLIKKAAGDLVNKRGDWRSNVSRIVYYGVVQNIIFSGLQSAIFALAFDDEDDDEQLDKKSERMLNGMIDSLLRGSGLAGAVVATLKNTILKFMAESKKDFRADYGNVLVEALNVSPPIGSKARKLYNSTKTYKFNKEVMGEMETLDLENPVYDIVGNVVEATTNVPLNRGFRKVDNLKEMLNQDNETWQRVFVGLGWDQWSLGIDSRKEVEEAREEIKEKKKEEKKKTQQRCTKIKSDGTRCKIMITKPKTRCHYHD